MTTTTTRCEHEHGHFDGGSWFCGMVCGVALFSLIVILASVFGSDDSDNPMAQSNFPCAEDHVLTYWPGVKDEVACVHWDTVRAFTWLTSEPSYEQLGHPLPTLTPLPPAYQYNRP